MHVYSYIDQCAHVYSVFDDYVYLLCRHILRNYYGCRIILVLKMSYLYAVKSLIGQSFSDAAMQADKLHNRAAADDLLGKSLNAIKGAQDKIRLAANERRQSLQLQLLEDIADQLQEIKDAADAGRNLLCISPKTPKKI